MTRKQYNELYPDTRDVSTPTICQMFPFSMREEFFRRIYWRRWMKQWKRAERLRKDQ